MKKINCKNATIEELMQAFYTGIPIEGITQIGTHYGPHNDELCAGWLLRNTPQGKQRFPGIEAESVAFGPISGSQLRKCNLFGEEGFFKALQSGLLLIGIGGGPLDEHGNRKEHISCTQRVVSMLDLLRDKKDRKVYGRLVWYVNFEDGNGDNAIECLNRIRTWMNTSLSSEKHIPMLTEDESDSLQALQIGAFAQNLKKGFEIAGTDVKMQSEIFQMAFRFYETEIEQSRLFVETEMEYERTPKNQIDLVTPGLSDPFVLLELESDALIMNKVVHSRWRDNRVKKLGVLFLRRTNGQFVLMPNQKHITTNMMREVVKVLRQIIAKNRRQETVRFRELGADQVIDSIPEIHFDETRGIISNGSKSDPDVPGLIGKGLSVQNVIEAVQIGLDTKYFAEQFSKKCAAGTCVGGKCWMYDYGQKRCHDIRDAEKVKNSQIGQAFKQLSAEKQRKSA